MAATAELSNHVVISKTKTRLEVLRNLIHFPSQFILWPLNDVEISFLMKYPQTGHFPHEIYMVYEIPYALEKINHFILECSLLQCQKALFSFFFTQNQGGFCKGGAWHVPAF